MKKQGLIAGFALAGIFATTAAAGSYEHKKLAPLVKNDREVGQVNLKESDKSVMVVTLQMERQSGFLKREQRSDDLYVYFNAQTGQPDYENVCVQHDYAVSGIYRRAKTPLLKRYEDNLSPEVPQSIINEFEKHYDGSLAFNERDGFGLAAPSDCGLDAVQRHPDAMEKAVEAYRTRTQQLKPNL